MEDQVTQIPKRTRRPEGAGPSGLGRAIRYLGHYKKYAILAYLFLFISTGAMLMVPQLMQRIIDTRRTGRRSVLTDGAFKRQHAFVPDAASVVAYGDPQRLDRALAQIEPLLERWGTDVQSMVRDLRRVTPLGGHFPAGAVYAVRETDRLVWRGWLQEGR